MTLIVVPRDTRARWLIGRTRASHAGDRRFLARSSHTNVLSNLNLSLPSMALGINRIGQGLGSSMQDDVT